MLPARDEGVEFDPEAVARIIELSEAYPYFLQEYGRHVWRIAGKSPIGVAEVEGAHPNVEVDLDEGFFTVRFERATAAERRYMAAMAALGGGAQESGNVARRLGHSDSTQASVVRANLIDKGLIYSPEYGLVDFTVPHFANFMQRNYPLEG